MKYSNPINSIKSLTEKKGLLFLKPALFYAQFVAFILIGLCVVKTSLAQQAVLTDEVKQISNEVIKNIFDDILALKNKYPGLEGFSENSLSINQHGIYSIEYQYETIDVGKKLNRFGFALTVVKNNDTNYSEYGQASFNYGFPFLKLKLAGYEVRPRYSKSFDLQYFIRKYGHRLWEAQQKFLPLNIFLEPTKPSFKVGEPVEFVVTLRNVSKHNIFVKPLSEKSLAFIYDDKPWGAQRTTKLNRKNDIILNAGEEIQQVFQGTAFDEPKNFEIFCSYQQVYEGVSPTTSLAISIVR